MTYSIASLVVSAVCFWAAYVLRRRKAAKQLKTQETAWDEFRPLEADLPQVVDWATFHERVWDRTRMTVCDNHNVTKLDGGWYVFDGLAHQKVPSSVTLAEALSMFDNLSTCAEVPSDTNLRGHADAYDGVPLVGVSPSNTNPGPHLLEPQSDAESPAPSADHVATSNVWANWTPIVYGVNWSTLAPIPDPSPTVSCSSAAAFLGYATDSADEGDSVTVSFGGESAQWTAKSSIVAGDQVNVADLEPVPAKAEGSTRDPVAEGDWVLYDGHVYKISEHWVPKHTASPLSTVALRGTLLRRAADGFVVGDQVTIQSLHSDDTYPGVVVEALEDRTDRVWVLSETFSGFSDRPIRRFNDERGLVNLVNPVQLTSPWVGRQVHIGGGRQSQCVWADQDTLTLGDGATVAASDAELHWDDVRVGDMEFTPGAAASVLIKQVRDGGWSCYSTTRDIRVRFREGLISTFIPAGSQGDQVQVVDADARA